MPKLNKAQEEAKIHTERGAVKALLGVMGGLSVRESFKRAAASERKVKEMCFCQSYYNDDNELQDCTCGKCE